MRFLVLCGVHSLVFGALAADYPSVTGIAAEAVIIPAAEAKRQATAFGAHAFWTPTSADIQKIEAQLPGFLQAEAVRDRDFREQITEVRHRLRDYRRQYVGLISTERNRSL